MTHAFTSLPAFRRQNILIEFASLQHACPRGIYLSLSPSDPTIWHGVLFIRRGIDRLYRGAILKFLLSFPPQYPSSPPDVVLQTRVFHPLVSSKTGIFSFPQGAAVEGVLEILERFKRSFEEREVLDGIGEREVVDVEAWKAWNGRREGSGGWDERVQRCIMKIVDAVEAGTTVEDDVIRFADIPREGAEELVEEARRGLAERGIEVREY